jgi:predicted CopG family antitoxin
MEKQLKYRDLISQSAEASKKEELEFVAEEAGQQLDSDILATKKEIKRLNRDLVALKKNMPLNPQSCVDKMTSIKQHEAGLAALEALKSELF